jgi:transcription elongation GreA/GreB family factor
LIDKEIIRQAILTQLSTDHQNAVLAANTAHAAATNEESKAENKYDTRGVEASYLAEGQSRRVAELETSIAAYEGLLLSEFDESTKIRLTALVTLVDSEGNNRCLFVGPDGGGLVLALSIGECIVVTPMAPLGKALIGKYVGDEVAVNAADKITTYEILSIN